MSGPTPPELDGLLAAAESGDADAMLELGMYWSRACADAAQQARAWLRASARGGSLDGRIALAARHVADGEFRAAQWQLQVAETEHPPLRTSQQVGVAPNVFGPHLAPDGDGEADTGLYSVFTVITTEPHPAAAALDGVRDTLLAIDPTAFGTASGAPRQTEAADTPAPAPRYVAEVEVSWLGARVLIDTGGQLSGVVGRRIVDVLSHALGEAGVAAVIGGRCAELDGQFVTWSDASVRG